MSSPSLENLKQYLPFATGLVLALLALIYFIFSGQGSANLNTRTLQNSDPKVESIQIKDEPAGDKNAYIKCKDGSTYEIYYPPGETNFDAISASKCPQD